jgi:hypothetical protein
MKPASKAEKRRARDAAAIVAQLTPEQWWEVHRSYHTVGAGYLVCKRPRWPDGVIGPYSTGRVRLTDPLGILVREIIRSTNLSPDTLNLENARG